MICRFWKCRGIFLYFWEVRLYNNYACITVIRLKDIAQLINILDEYPLQGSKWLIGVS